ncbi:Carboxylesterase NlhH [Rubripirellula tenax]|uniref:Carboxylesterase NlhH n=1 Tax=Rubripirellula tenax TaxID=2528015 RepID=A0A5C6EZ16_9BACT|nr:alpha/beta hydrolase [Rubripirellula tenax]TWU54398.1 Carboxylesterase NlhH [Rubripirellula tenax]
MSLHPQAQAFVDSIAERNPPAWQELTPDEARAAFAGLTELFGTGPDIKRVEDITLAGDIRARLYSDVVGQASPLVMFFHGGGWVLGSLDTHDAVCRRLAAMSQCTVISVDYQRSPESPFPGPVDECFRATAAVVDAAADFAIDAGKIAVAGDSAGGTLAAAVAIKARDQGGPAIRLQVLIYPVIAPDFETKSYRDYATGHGLTRATMEYFWRQYLGEQDPRDPNLSSLAVPSRAASHAGLPEAHVITAGYDVLSNEGEAYAKMLTAAGVTTTTKRYDSMLHGFVHFAGFFDTGIEATTEIAQRIRAKLT